MARTTAVTKAKGTAVSADLATQMAQEVEDLRTRLAAPSGDRIKVDNKIFTLPNGDTADLLTAIVVDFVYTNNYYEGAFDPNNIVPPNCFAISVEPTGAIPSENSPDRQDDSCQKCWANQFGSAGKGKACRNSVLLALLPPDANEETPLMVISVSATALKPWAAYASAVARALQRPPYGVTTDFNCDPNFKYDTLRFSNPQPLDADMIALVRSRREEARARLLVEPDVSALAAANEAPAKKAPAKGRLAPAKKRA